jgi:hypothetical protein
MLGPEDVTELSRKLFGGVDPKSVPAEKGWLAPRGPSPRLVTRWFAGLFAAEALHVIPGCGVADAIDTDHAASSA